MNILSNPFSLPAAFDERAVRVTQKKANLGLVQFGANAQLSPEAINRFGSSVNEVLRRSVMAGAGVASLSARPTATGLVLTIPIQTLNLLGHPVPFTYRNTTIGQPDVAFTYDFTASADGNYAVVIEWCEAPVLPSSTNGLPPTAIAGQNSALNKIDNSTFYTAGNLTRNNAADGTADASMRLNTSVQAIRASQIQYNTQVITDATLVGVAATLATGTFSAAPADEPNLVRLDLPSDYLSLTPRTTNGYVYAAKLCVVVKNAGTLAIYTGDNIPIGLIATQKPIPVAPTRDAIQTQLNTVSATASGAASAIADHLADATDAHDASAISITTISGVTATDVQGALSALRTQVAATESENTSQATAIAGLQANRYTPFLSLKTIHSYNDDTGMTGTALDNGGVLLGGANYSMNTIGSSGAAGLYLIGNANSSSTIKWSALNDIPNDAKMIRVRIKAITRAAQNGYKAFVATASNVTNALTLPEHQLRAYAVELSAVDSGATGNTLSAHGELDIPMPSPVSNVKEFLAGLYLPNGVATGSNELTNWGMVLVGYYT